ncbi:phenylalanine-4-hydroxylase [Litorimonas cladophorae]|uniref:Phenylalanine-4-hydroxylase n=1 Tax=Litorimonas cladophorae TaxID=1220491 RepID=A0A918NAG9_9PROT|nr:phenylalanine 4-monooxygenase [Litorimonas cladophorae]GGX58349.1 phenylalanine-4-hydroxylase [Litorimonas cladophorae]
MTHASINDPVVARQTPRADFSIDQCWEEYTEEEHAIWDLLYARQVELLQDRAAPEFLAGLERLSLSQSGIPNLETLNDALSALTGWKIVMVPHLVPDDVFFTHLANRRFPAGRFIRGRHQLDYLQEPDVFHDIFGHVPMLANPVFADYMQAYGQGGLRALNLGTLHNLARLYWYTVEFGLIETPNGLRIYGAGIVSSAGESHYCLEDAEPQRIRFDMERIMRTEYEIDIFQKTYFVIESYKQLFEATQQDFAPIYERLTTDNTNYGTRDAAPDDKLLK